VSSRGKTEVKRLRCFERRGNLEALVAGHCRGVKKKIRHAVFGRLRQTARLVTVRSVTRAKKASFILSFSFQRSNSVVPKTNSPERRPYSIRALSNSTTPRAIGVQVSSAAAGPAAMFRRLPFMISLDGLLVSTISSSSSRDSRCALRWLISMLLSSNPNAGLEVARTPGGSAAVALPSSICSSTVSTAPRPGCVFSNHSVLNALACGTFEGVPIARDRGIPLELETKRSSSQCVSTISV